MGEAVKGKPGKANAFPDFFLFEGFAVNDRLYG